MSVRNVTKYGNPILRKNVDDVADLDHLESIIKDMFDTMYAEEGIGLAANQIGLDMSMLVLDVTDVEEDIETGQMVMINPVITQTSGSSTMEEGCLSLPDIRVEVRRPDHVTVEYTDISGDKHTEEYSGLVSRVIQHEVDHLNGRFITDHLSATRRSLVQKRLQEIATNGRPSRSVTI